MLPMPKDFAINEQVQFGVGEVNDHTEERFDKAYVFQFAENVSREEGQASLEDAFGFAVVNKTDKCPPPPESLREIVMQDIDNNRTFHFYFVDVNDEGERADYAKFVSRVIPAFLDLEFPELKTATMEAFVGNNFEMGTDLSTGEHFTDGSRFNALKSGEKIH